MNPVHDANRELAELQEYLGDAYDDARIKLYEEQLDAEYEQIGDEQRMYRESQGYLYNLTAFAMTGTKLPYHAMLARHVPRGARLLDYGCGIGSDGLAFLEAGYDVAFADFDNPSTRYLRWRLERRGLQAPIYDLDAGPPPGGFDATYAFDVIEHVEDPFAFLARMEEQAGLVLVNFLEPEEGETELHRELPVDALVAHAAARDLRDYRIEHGRSHVVLYGPEPAQGLARLRGRALPMLARCRRWIASRSAGG